MRRGDQGDLGGLRRPRRRRAGPRGAAVARRGGGGPARAAAAARGGAGDARRPGGPAAARWRHERPGSRRRPRRLHATLRRAARRARGARALPLARRGGGVEVRARAGGGAVARRLLRGGAHKAPAAPAPAAPPPPPPRPPLRVRYLHARGREKLRAAARPPPADAPDAPGSPPAPAPRPNAAAPPPPEKRRRSHGGRLARRRRARPGGRGAARLPRRARGGRRRLVGDVPLRLHLPGAVATGTRVATTARPGDRHVVLDVVGPADDVVASRKLGLGALAADGAAAAAPRWVRFAKDAQVMLGVELSARAAAAAPPSPPPPAVSREAAPAAPPAAPPRRRRRTDWLSAGESSGPVLIQLVRAPGGVASLQIREGAGLCRRVVGAAEVAVGGAAVAALVQKGAALRLAVRRGAGAATLRFHGDAWAGQRRLALRGGAAPASGAAAVVRSTPLAGTLVAIKVAAAPPPGRTPRRVAPPEPRQAARPRRRAPPLPRGRRRRRPARRPRGRGRRPRRGPRRDPGARRGPARRAGPDLARRLGALPRRRRSVRGHSLRRRRGAARTRNSMMMSRESGSLADVQAVTVGVRIKPDLRSL